MTELAFVSVPGAHGKTWECRIPYPRFKAYLATALRCMAAGLQSQASSERKAFVGRKHT
ncbi:hypothetical protein L210DRAFT_3538016 [Boletus edulis BED1]|uniref:Uncharacterized protein n=1 Tax=Boletus edulis BED1 TaxID=1328754 RepID=A0AAD4BW65_BOLED|nr:hypothetical protein L210DRAFT_3538016 [Boletus edulis BED1]